MNCLRISLVTQKDVFCTSLTSIILLGRIKPLNDVCDNLNRKHVFNRPGRVQRSVICLFHSNRMTGTCHSRSRSCSFDYNLLSSQLNSLSISSSTSHSQKWHNGAAKSAQKWAESCRLLTHDTAKGRYIDNYGACGQNIFVSTQKVPW